MKLRSLLLSLAVLFPVLLHSAPVRHILFIGDSITYHAPASHLGWSGDWGMAASSRDSDYVHRLVARFAAEQDVRPVFVTNAVGGGAIPGKLADRTRLMAQVAEADLVIIQMGENDNTVTPEGFGAPYEQLVRLVLQAKPSVRLICTGVWSPTGGHAVKDDFIRDICSRLRIPFADLAAVNADPKNRAGSTGRWTNAGVNWHPSDAGMAAYAEAIWATWLKGDAAIPATPEARVMLSERFDDPNTFPLWHGVTSDQVETGVLGSRLRLTNSRPNTSVYATRWLDVAVFAGQRVKISARISGESVGVPPKPYNGIKLMLVVKDPAGKTDQPQAAAAFSGNFEPRLIQFTHAIPADSQEIQLKLGLELAAGSVFYEDIRIEAAP